MLSAKLNQRIKSYVAILQTFADRIWYPPFIGLLAALDNIVVIIPNDGILISSSMLTPKRWVLLASTVTVGSTLGAVGLAILIQLQGLPWILDLFPGADQTTTWRLTHDFFQQYGLIVVFAVALTPLMQQPAVILASLAGTPILVLGSIIFFGRLIKYLIMAYIGAHAPRLLGRMWGLKGELSDAGIEIKKSV